MKQAAYPFKFSFVMPVYNVETYLAETIESILAQTMDFEQNCELILVNDGSRDNSEEVCLRYRDQFPNNITYIKQKNLGVCAARNRGIDEVQGRYVSFLDSDDKLSSDTLSEVYNFFEKHGSEIDLVSIKLEYFEARTGDHPLNYKFTSDRVIDIEKEWDAVQLSGGSIFVKSSVFRSGHRFDPNVGNYGEDAKFCTEVILNKKAYGIVAAPTYYYRKRLSSGSSLDTTLTHKFWYLNTPNLVFREILELAKRSYGSIPKYVQYVVMYDLQWRFKQSTQSVLSNEELKEYKEILKSLVNYIDDDVIMAQRYIPDEYKFFILSKKYNRSVVKHAHRKGSIFSFYDIELYDYSTKTPALHIEFFEYTEGKAVIEGYFNGFLFNGTKLCFRVGKKLYDVERIQRPLRRVTFFDELVYDRNCFKVELAADSYSVIKPVVVADSIEWHPNLIAHKHSRFDQTTRMAYRVYDDVIINKTLREFAVYPNTGFTRFTWELRYLSGLMKQRKVRDVAIRSLYFLSKSLLRREIWLISDRINAAGDNGEALFRYIVEQQNEGIRPYFAISRKSDDFTRMKQYGKVIDRDSFRYKFLFLLSNKIISSHADDFVTNAFGRQYTSFINLYAFDFVFLQHGITKDDISSWLNRYNKNIKLFVAGAKPEYKSLLEGSYGYDSHVVKLTGFPRYDLLESKPKRKLILAPTWRRHLVVPADQKTGLRDDNNSFIESEYYKFYQGIMDDKRIRTALKSAGMTGELYLHPSLQQQIKDFHGNDQFFIKGMPYDYRTAFSEGDMLISDYSSVVFDFAYLKKPVLYTQFDRETFYQGHIYTEGYFSYERDGFGPVVYDYESAVKEILSIIESDCKMPKTYQKRVENFFYKFDRNNRKRVYNALLAMNKGK